ARWRTDGSLEYLGRNDFQVKIRGFRIELGEIEAQLAKVAGVRETVVLARDSGSPAGEKRLVAYYTGNADVAALREQATRHLPAYMVPSAYVRLDAWPLTPNGKLDRRALPAPADDAYARAEYEAPQGAKEEALAAIWKDLLPVERISRHDNFFELGGHSLLVIGLSEKLRAAGLHADVRVVYRASTLADLAAHLGTDNQDIRIPLNLIADGDEHITPAQLTLVALSQESIDALVAKVEGGAANVQDIYPLAPLQEGILFHHLMSGESDPYVLSGVLAFRSREVMERFVSALQQVIDRHDILRTGFFWEGLEQPVQVVQRRATLPVSVVELDAREGDIVRQLEARFDSRGYRMDVSRAPLMHVHAACDGEHERWVARVLFHHLSIDHTTLERVIEEARAIGQGRAEDLPQPVPFRNFVAQARLGVSEADHEAYFRAKLGDIDEPTAPFGLLSVQGDGREIAEAARTLKPELSGALRGHARRLGVSAASMMHVAWGLVLSRTTGRQDVVFGTVLFGRMQGGAQSDRALGLFINTLPVRMRVAQTGVEASVKETHAQLAELMRHEHAPLVLAQRCSGVPAQTPLFTSLLNYRYGLRHRADAATPGGDDIELLSARERTNYPLTLSVDDLGQDFSLTVQVSGHVDPQRVCAFMETALEQLAQALGEQPQCNIGGLDVLPRSEREQMVYAWNATERDYPIEQCIHQLFEAQVDRKPEAIALTFDGQRLSYAELNARANRLAHYLQARGVGPDRLVALCAERGIEMVVGLLAILKAGGAYVPLDPAYASDRLRGIVEDSQPALVLADAVGRAALGELDGALPVIDLETDALRWREMPATNPEVASQHVHHLAYVIYTSGSTGRPKGVMVEHAQVVRLFGATQAWFGFDERDVWTLFHSYGFDFSVWELWGALLHGGRLVIVPTEVTRTPSAFFALLCAEGVTVLNQTPSAFQALMSAQEEREEAALKADVDAEAEAAGNIERANVVAHRLRYVIFGGEALEPRTLASWYARHGERTQLVNMYGITETTVHVTYCALRAEDAMRLGASPIGVRIPDLQLYVLDDRREPVPMGVTGELYVGGAGVARGYLNRPELTRERFIDDPFVAGGRLYKTGDLARWRTDGSLEYLGRNDFQVKIRGFRIELGEIEAQLAKVAGVREVVVLARDSAAEVRDNATPNVPTPKSSSETEKRLVAYYTGDADVAALRAQAAQHLPSYMVPSAYVRLDAWPLTPNGKLDRRALPAPADDAYARAEYEAPQGAKEEALAAIWRELLHVERVSRHDNFFELGGHSLLAIGVIERMRREGLHTDVRSIFNAQTLSDLAARAQTDDRSIQAPPNLIPARATRITPGMLPLVALTQTQIDMLAAQVEGGAANIQDIYPLAPLQEGMVFHHLLHAESDAYMEAYFVGFRTRARLDRFLDALRMIVDRHDILRTGFFWEGLEQPVQIVQRRVRLPIEFVDLDPADGDVLRQLEARHDPRAHRLDIRRPALLSCHAAHDPAAGRWLLCVMAHHLAIDNTSLKLLVAEEQAIEQGGFDALPPAPSFRNFIAQIASGVDRREHEAFFSAMLGDIDSPTHPFGLQDVQGDGREIAEFQQRLSPELSKAIRVCTRRLGVSPASLMHLAWAMVLSRATGRREAVFGTVLFGRMQGGERGMGMFINTLPIRIDVDERYVAECLAHTHERVVQLIYHEHAPLALALRCSGLPARQALFSSLLNYRHSEQAARPPRDDDDIQYLDGNERTNYPLTVSIDDLGEAFSVTVQARHPASPERIRAFMETALEQLVRALDGTSGVAAPGVVTPRIAVRDIDVLPSEERHRLLVEWNDTAADYPQDQCLHRLFEAQAARYPDTIALIADGEPVGYAELNRRANRLARHLSARGLQPDQRVAICIDRGIDMVVAMLAVLKAGGAYVPLDPAYPSERLDYLLRDCAPVALLTHARLGASMQTRLVLALARLDTGCALIDLESDAGAWRHERDDDPPPSGLTPRHLAYVIYTSGSTGQPKGVMVEHRSVCNLVAWHAGAFDVGTGCRSASVAGVAFDATTWEVWAALCNGGCLSLAPGDAASDPQALLRWWRAQELDVGFLVTPLAELAYATGQSNAGMRTLLIGGDRLSRWPDSMPPGQMLVNNYGPTEATVVATSGRLQPGEATPPIGRPIANTRVYVLDAWLRPAPIGVAGELYIGGVQVARGYLNRPELTRERFIDDPFVAGGRLYRTGDLARWRTDGRLEYLGRNDFQVKIRGLERVIEEARAIGQGRAEDLPQPVPFRNFVAQARLGVSEADHEAYFRAKLGDIDEPTAPFGLLSVQGDGREIAEAARTLKPELSGALRGHARRLGVSAASMMHVAWGLVLSRTTGRQDVVFGTVLFGRMQGGAQSDRALGLFINTLPVRMRVAQTGVEASVKETHAQLAELMRHEHAPLVLAQRCSGVPAQTPLFTSLLNYRYSKPKVAAAHIADGVELLDGHERTNYPVSVDIDDHGDDFKIRAQAAASVDPARVCDFLEVALTRLVDALERDPHGALRQLDILPEVEREEVVRRWNAGEKARPSRLCLHELFERQAARAPDAIAVIQDERALTYAELNRCANRLAHYLRARGVRGGDRVALYARRSPELLIGMLATLKAGGAYVPLDPGYPAERLTHMLLDSAPVVVLRDAAASNDVLVRLNAGTPILDLHADDERWSAQPSGNLKLCGSHEPDVGARRLAYVIYTSGSTGAPKGVMVEHASVVNQIGALTEYLELDASDRVLQFSNIAFDASVEEIFATLSCGATLVLRTDRWLADAETFWALCGAQRISIVDLPAQFFGQLALSGRRAVPTGVRCVVIGGEAVGASALDAWFAEEGRRPRLFNTYGPTETTVSVTVHEVRGRHDDANVIGRPIANTRVYVLDAWLRPAPIGVAGELYIGGVQVARGYLNRPELTRERFIDDPFVAGGRLYRTGDLARWRTDGRLEYLGRNDFQVKIRGFRIELGEIEAQLAKVAGVREVVVLARDSASAVHDSATENAAPDAPSPETATAPEKRLVAYYTGDADVTALRAQAAQNLPSYMVPSAYVRLDAWPLTPNGKLDRRA
ncbi:non-ribosomal peptide synthetase, partial [Burkholderia pseudomallei]|uniref:non-ribosomal peptide synthetase n=15 Tax=Burkholderia pseudomallei TaxID=28450 RepID=UPI000F09673C